MKTSSWDGKHIVYRCYAADGALLYIGFTSNLALRRKQHINEGSYWADQVTRIKLATYPTRQEAHGAERAAIRAERPMFNSLGRGSQDQWTKAEFYGDWIYAIDRGLTATERTKALRDRYRAKFGGDLLELTRAEAVAQYQQPVAAEAA